MFRTHLHRSLTAWVATCAILLGALAPTVTQLLASLARGQAGEAAAVAASLAHASGALADGAQEHEACADEAGHEAGGHPHVDAHQGGGDPGSSGHPGGHGSAGTGHCPFCGTYAGSFALPPAHAPAAVQTDAVHPYRPPLHARAPRPLFAWAAAHPRAPPRFLFA